MAIPVACHCGHVWRVDADLAGRRILCPGCEQRVEVPSIESIAVVCPNSACGRSMTLRIPRGVEAPQCRCPACKTIFEIGPAPMEEPTTGYGLAAETSVNYLLTREENGHRLSREERATKKKLIAERLSAKPECCPACERKWNRERQRCKACGFDLASGKRIVKDYTPGGYATSRTAVIAASGMAVSSDGVVGEIAGQVLGAIIEGLLS